MYIIKTVSKNKNNSSEKYYTYRLVESIRIGKKVKQQTLINLGSDFSVEQDKWSLLSNRVNDILRQTGSLFPIDKDLESLAKQYALQIITSKARIQEDSFGSGNDNNDNSNNSNSSNNDNNPCGDDNCSNINDNSNNDNSRNTVDNNSSDNSANNNNNTNTIIKTVKDDKYKEIDTDTVINSNCKKIGVENIIYETIKELQLPLKLQELGFTNKQLNSAIGVIVAKIANPSSEAKSYDWLCNTSGINELLDCDFNKMSSNSIYRVSDMLLANKVALEEHLYNRQKEIFNYDETITLYDLTNTYFEGKAQGVEKAKRGRSKEKRSDAPIITLAIMLDSSGFVRKSEIFDGNVSEPKTFQQMLDLLKVGRDNNNLFNSKKSLVVMDAGIASQENIDYLVENGYEYIVVSRKDNKQFDEEKAVAVKLNSKEEVIVRAQKVINEETKECELFIHSKDKELKENKKKKREQTLFIEKLQYIKDGLSLPKRTKEYAKVIETIGRIKEKCSSIAQYYTVTITKDPDLKGKNAIDISWSEKRSLDKKSAINGIYCLRTNNKTMDEQTLWKTYTTLTQLEAVFRSLKSELGLRPIFHQKQSRVDGHLFITLLAYSIIHTIRYKLKKKEINYSFETIRDILENQQRVTTSMKCKDGTTLYIRQSSELTCKQKEIYDALNIKHQAGERVKVYI